MSKTNKLLGLRSINLKTEYNTDDDDIIEKLYAPCLSKSITYDRAVGYFRANIYRELGEPLLDFVIKGGKIRIVCSPDIPELDEDAARTGYTYRGSKQDGFYKISLIKIMEIMANNPDERDCLEMLRLLIEANKLDLFIAVRPGGIYHRKIGKFEDQFGNKVVFAGSGNETRPALVSIEDWVNDEDFDIYRSWGDDFEKEKLSIKENHLKRLFDGKSGRTEVRKINEIEREFINLFRSYRELEDCREGAKKRSKITEKQEIIHPYPYQIEAIESLKKANMTGMLSMATGTGKTFTALFAIQDFISKGIPILILVPTNVLIDQWIKNINKIYPNVPILVAGGGYDWRNNRYKRMFVSKIDKSRIILSTMATASMYDFIEFIKQAKNMILIADEAHRLGSEKNKEILKLDFKAKIGLSATPERLFDEEGNQALQNAFGVEPVYNLPINSIVEIEDGKKVPILGYFLSKYNFYYYTVKLEYEEEKEWDEITSELIKKYVILKNDDKEKYKKIKDDLKYLLIKRAKIIKKANNKKKIIVDIIHELYPKDGNWIIYCEDEEQLDDVYNNLSDEFKFITFLKYHSKMHKADKESVLNYFENNPSIVVSIRCLDEGVDIPKSDGAVILASSKNPRQYIQRRGRVLRQFKGKRHADIIDVIVEPTKTETDIPHSIIKSEISRAWNFAQNAQNRNILHELWKLCLTHKVNISLDAELSIEEEEENE